MPGTTSWSPVEPRAMYSQLMIRGAICQVQPSDHVCVEPCARYSKFSLSLMKACARYSQHVTCEAMCQLQPTWLGGEPSRVSHSSLVMCATIYQVQPAVHVLSMCQVQPAGHGWRHVP
jgi:hypothetical protein